MIIGRIEFGIDANTRGLKKAAAEIVKFRTVVTQASRGQSKAAKQTAAALGKQESAMKKAFQANLQYAQSLKNAGVKGKEFAAAMKPADAALNRYIKELKSGRLNSVQFARATDGLSAKMNRIKRDFRSGAGAGGKMNNMLRNLESASVFAVGPLSGLGARIRSFGAITSRATLLVAGLLAGIAAAVLGFIKLAGAALRADMALEKAEARFIAISGSSRMAAEEMAFVTKTANKLGLDFKQTADAYSRFAASTQGTSIEGKKARLVFEQMSRAAAGLRLNGEEVGRMFRALEQIMSKGTVQAEEIRGQLGDVLPGSFRIAAESAGQTTQAFNKFLKAGKAISDEFVPGFAAAAAEAFGKDAEANATTLAGSITILGNNFVQLANAMNDSVGMSRVFAIWVGHVSWSLETMVGWFEKAPEPIDEATAALEALVKEGERAMKTVDAFTAGPKFTDGFQDQADDIQELITEMEGLTQAARDFEAGLPMTLAMNKMEAATMLAGMGMKDTYNMAKLLGKELGVVVVADVEAVTIALAQYISMLELANENQQRLAKRGDTFKDAAKDLAEMTARLSVMRKGNLDQLEIYDKLTKVTEAWRDSLIEGGLSQDEATSRAEKFYALLAEQFALQKKMDDAEKDRLDAIKKKAKLLKEIERNQVKANKAMKRANETLALMQRRVAAIASGPTSLRIFNDIIRPTEQFRIRLEAVVDAQGKMLLTQAQINGLLVQYQTLITQQANLTGPLADAADEMGESFAKAFEAAATGAESFGDAAKNMLEDIYRTLLRTLIIDPIKESLQTQLKNFMTQSGSIGGMAPGFLKGAAKAPPQVTATTGPPGTPGSTLMGPPAPLVAVAEKQAKVAEKFDGTVDTFQETIDTFTEAIDKMNRCCMCDAGEKIGNAGTAMSEAATGLVSSSTYLQKAGYSIENAARHMENKAAIEAKLEKSGRIFDLIGKGVAAYGAASGASGGGGSGGAFGATTVPGTLHPVMERGLPELYTMRNRDYLMSPERGRIEPLEQSGKGSTSITTNVYLPPERRRRTVDQEAFQISRLQARSFKRNR